jgi:16S rRNA (guanine527-N7)-methyltransferase
VDRDKIAALLRPYIAELSPAQLESTSIYIDILLKWNARINLTAVRNPEEIVTRHFGESYFAAAQLLAPPARVDVIDVGSGAGFPGLPIGIFAHDARLTLLESNAKKAAFLNEVIAALVLKNVRVFNGRAEAYSETADLVTMRAVEKFDKSLPVALRMVREDGRIALMIGAAQEQAATASAPGFRWNSSVPIPGSESRVLFVGTKLGKVE